MSEPNAQMVVLARESRGYTQTELADAIAVGQGTLSKVENRQIPAFNDLIERLSSRLNYPREFFYQECRQKNLPLTFYRKRARVSARTLRAVRATINIRCLELERLLRSADLPPARVPLINASDFRGDIERIARDLRTRWHL